MTAQTLKGYVLAIFSGLVMLAGAVLLLLQVSNHAEFSFYGQNISIRFQSDGSTSGGFNTALLMLCSAAGGLLYWWLVRIFIRGLRSLAAGRKLARQAEITNRLDALTRSPTGQAQGQTAGQAQEQTAGQDDKPA